MTKNNYLDKYDGKYVVYIITFPNGKRYCGYSSNIKRRWRSINEYRTQTYLYNALKKYGFDKVQKEVIFSFDNKEEALAKEKEIIDKENLLNPEIGYNLVEGGGDPPHGKQYITPEGLEKTRDNGKRLANEIWGNEEKRKEVIEKMKIADREVAKNMTPEERKKRYGKRLGISPTNTREIYQIDKDTNEIINKYKSSYDAGRALGKSEYSNNIRSVACGNRKTAYGYKWKWCDEYENNGN